jgi:hypothetical protein
MVADRRTEQDASHPRDVQNKAAATKGDLGAMWSL